VEVIKLNSYWFPCASPTPGSLGVQFIPCDSHTLVFFKVVTEIQMSGPAMCI